MTYPQTVWRVNLENFKFFITVKKDDDEVHTQELGAEALARVLSGIADMPSNQELIYYIANSKSFEVRKDVAYREKINVATLELLVQDTSIDVRRALCSQQAFSDWATTEIILDYANSDVECAKIIAGKLNDYSNADVSMIAKALLDHPDPEVRNVLANGWNIPKQILKKLLSDEDPGVRATAQNSLS